MQLQVPHARNADHCPIGSLTGLGRPRRTYAPLYVTRSTACMPTRVVQLPAYLLPGGSLLFLLQHAVCSSWDGWMDECSLKNRCMTTSWGGDRPIGHPVDRQALPTARWAIAHALKYA